jgi:hypothetical protein
VLDSFGVEYGVLFYRVVRVWVLGNVMFRVPQHDSPGEYPLLRPGGYRFEFVELVGVYVCTARPV